MVKQIEELTELLNGEGFNSFDYIISLQGPTVFFTITGTKKMNTKIEEKIKKLNFIIN